MSQETNDPNKETNPYQSPKHPSKRWRLSVLTYAIIGIVTVTAVSAGAFITNKAISKNRNVFKDSFGGINRGPVPKRISTIDTATDDGVVVDRMPADAYDP